MATTISVYNSTNGEVYLVGERNGQDVAVIRSYDGERDLQFLWNAVKRFAVDEAIDALLTNASDVWVRGEAYTDLSQFSLTDLLVRAADGELMITIRGLSSVDVRHFFGLDARA